MSPGRVYLVLGLLLASVLAWRQGAIFSGEFDFVAVAKAVLGGTALMLAVLGRSRSVLPPPALLGGTLALLATYLMITLAGALYGGHFLATAVLAVRLVLIVATVLTLATKVSGRRLLAAFAWICASTAVVAAVTDVALHGFDERLSGGIPPIAANEVAFLAAVGILYFGWRASTESFPVAAWGFLPVLTAILWLTQSRTALLFLVIAFLVMVAQLRVVSAWTVIAASLVAPVVIYVLLMTDLVSEYLDRGGSGSVATLNSRTLAWEAAVTAAPHTWAQWFGQGLAVKTVEVDARFWTTQLLDSSWISAIVQAGWLGTGVLALLAGLVLVRILTTRSSLRPLALSLLGFTLGRSVLESGLFDASAAFVLFLLLAFSSFPDRDPRGPGEDAHALLRAATPSPGSRPSELVLLRRSAAAR